jgi:hypothetical protein
MSCFYFIYYTFVSIFIYIGSDFQQLLDELFFYSVWRMNFKIIKKNHKMFYLKRWQSAIRAVNNQVSRIAGTIGRGWANIVEVKCQATPLNCFLHPTRRLNSRMLGE